MVVIQDLFVINKPFNINRFKLWNYATFKFLRKIICCEIKKVHIDLNIEKIKY